MKKLLKIFWLIYKIIGTLLLTAIIVFWGIRLSVWYGNVNSFYKMKLDDGPHIFWLNDKNEPVKKILNEKINDRVVDFYRRASDECGL